jgi:putative FmdB family regulatory protein
MPIYEYLCQVCGAAFDKLVRQAAQADQVACPACESKQVQRKLSTFAVRGGSQPDATPAPAPARGGL